MKKTAILRITIISLFLFFALPQRLGAVVDADGYTILTVGSGQAYATLYDAYYYIAHGGSSITKFKIEIYGNTSETTRPVNPARDVEIQIYAVGGDRTVAFSLTTATRLFGFSTATVILGGGDHTLTFKINSSNEAAPFVRCNGGHLTILPNCVIDANNKSNIGVEVINAGTLVMSGGTIKNSKGSALSLANSESPFSGSVNISGGTISNSTTGVSFGHTSTTCSGTFTMSGGTIRDNGTNIVINKGNGCSMSGGEIYNATGDCNVNIKAGKFTMSGGRIAGKNASGLTYSNFQTNCGTANVAFNAIKNYLTTLLGTYSNAPVGVVVANGTTFEMTDGEICGIVCNATNAENKGAVVCDGTFNMSGGKIFGCYTASTAAVNAGLVMLKGTAVFNMTGGELSYCEGGSSPVRIGGSSTMTMSGSSSVKHCVLNGASPNAGGSAFRIVASTVTMNAGEIAYNTKYVSSDYYDTFGAAVSLNLNYDTSPNTIFNMNGGSIHNNKSLSTDGTTVVGMGGGVVVNYHSGTTSSSNYGQFNMAGGRIYDNLSWAGGGLCIRDRYARATISGGEISGNTASLGGGIYVTGSATLTLSGGKITGNNATATSTSATTASHSPTGIEGAGGGIYVRNTYSTQSTVAMNSSAGMVIYNNEASFAGDDIVFDGQYSKVTGFYSVEGLSVPGVSGAVSTGWYEDYFNSDTEHSGGKRYWKSLEDGTPVVKYTETGTLSNQYRALRVGFAGGEVIYKQAGLKSDENAIFTLSSKSGVHCTAHVPGTCTTVRRIKNLPEGYYQLVPKAGWTWVYTNPSASTFRQVKFDDTIDFGTFTFVPVSTTVKHDEDAEANNL